METVGVTSVAGFRWTRTSPSNGGRFRARSYSARSESSVNLLSSPPSAEMRQQGVERFGGNRLVWEMARGANRLTHLIEVDLAVGAARQVFVETPPRVG